MSAVVIILSAIAFSWLVVKLWPFTVDDAFITFRYAENLSRGYGPTFNRGAAPIEGYTSLTWTFLMALPHLLGMDAVIFAKVVGVGATLACIVVCYQWTRRLSESRGEEAHLPPSFAVALLASFAPTAVHAVSGMETALFTLSLVSFLYLTFSLLDRPSAQTMALLAIAALLVGLTRPEGNLVAVAGLGCTLVLLPRDCRPGLLRAALFFYLLPSALVFLWRMLYYGSALPLPFYVKLAPRELLSGVPTVKSFVTFMATSVGWLGLIGILRLSRKLVPAALSVVLLLLFFLFPAHAMGFQWRFLYPVAPVIFVVAASGLACLTSSLLTEHSPVRVLIVAAAIIAFTCGYWELRAAPATVSDRQAYAQGMAAAHIPLGKFLGSLRARSDTPVLAIGDAGAVPYYSGWKTIDTLGLNDNEIARSGRHDPEYVLSKRPDLLVLISTSGEEFRPPLSWEAGLYQESLAQGYMRVRTLRFAPTYFLWLMSSPQSPTMEQLQKWSASTSNGATRG